MNRIICTPAKLAWAMEPCDSALGNVFFFFFFFFFFFSLKKIFSFFFFFFLLLLFFLYSSYFSLCIYSPSLSVYIEFCKNDKDRLVLVRAS